MNQTIIKRGYSGLPVILVDEADSTNNYATRLLETEKVEEGTVVLTFRQTQGRGCGKNVWESENHKNLTFSLILLPTFLSASRQFLISQVVSLGLADFLLSKTDGVFVKWPNDLLVHHKKIAGILIENTVSGTNLNTSVIGIGININQSSFAPYLPHATSLMLETGQEHPLEETLNPITTEILKWYRILQNHHPGQIKERYLDLLYRKEEITTFRRENEEFEARIKGIDEYGQLILEKKPGITEAFPFKSIEMVF